MNQITGLAVQASRTMARKGFVRRNTLPRVTPSEHAWMLKSGLRKLASFTRLFEYDDSVYVEDTERPASSQAPRIIEIVVGRRSLDCIDDPKALGEEDMEELVFLSTIVDYCNDDGIPMVLDDDGTSRPARCGDTIEWIPSKVARHFMSKDGQIQNMPGLTDDLDALFMEEPDDPRQQNDSGAMGTDHTWSDRFRANTYLETKFLESNRFMGPKRSVASQELEYFKREGIKDRPAKVYDHLCQAGEQPESMPNKAVEDMLPMPDEITIRALAQMLALRMVEKSPTLRYRLLELTDMAEKKLMARHGEIRFDENRVLVSGEFIQKQDIFDAMDRFQNEWLEHSGSKKGAPAPINWKEIRGSSRRKS